MEQTSADDGNVGFDHTLTMAAAAHTLDGCQCRPRPGPRRQPQAPQGQVHRAHRRHFALIMAIGRALVAQEERHVEYSLFFV
jgi:hypothetical protein